MDTVTTFAVIGALGIGSQWLAWRFQLPAIVLMLVAGVVAGPVTGLLNPEDSFGELLKPIIAVAVAVILFEGGLTLNFKGLRDAGPSVLRLVIIGAPLGWVLSALAIRYGAGLSWESAIVFGGIMIVTGPTVITPLLRQARMQARPAQILKWEAIVNDPIGALAAVLAYEVVAALYTAHSVGDAFWHLAQGIVVAGVLGYLGGWFIARTFNRGKVPEYMKVPVLFGSVLAIYAASDNMLHESGLLAVTVMGVVLANAHLPSLEEIRRFKEHATVILVSGVFILLAASLTVEQLGSINLRMVLFVAIVVLVVRPVTVLTSLIGTKLPWRERAMIAWIGPRGVVLVAVSGLFGTQLTALGIEDGQNLTPLAFALVAGTVVLHGFSMAPLARRLGLTSNAVPGLMIVGGSRWAVNLATALNKADIPTMIVDRNWFRLRSARDAGLKVYHGEILSETAEHTLDLTPYGMVLAATDNNDYNALVGTDLGPEFGRGQVFQVGRSDEAEGRRALPATLGGRAFGDGIPYEEFMRREADGWAFRITKLTEEFGLDDYLAVNEGAHILGRIKESGLLLYDGKLPETIPAGTRILTFMRKQEARNAE
ncbi:NhaP-type Na+/H+ or K+/H+ antiporter [Monaibacterium marinum]|uniref:NhaP-type Na+/H+ or K+/H+ antiporter n=1 Tax=Pontivivens marinum TaxID=1690039 RepID=A0A2C9CLW0_9RHOB|nr:sodium:proton antiporter [Monaibacterium marinum]SOH92356.1 NhaP-type Na+/H+ or K+/H+ antiporter [Monaibacterium marinum]